MSKRPGGDPNVQQSMAVSKATPKFQEPNFAQLNKESKFDKEVLKKWKEKPTLSPPNRRCNHTTLIYNNFLYIFGGKDISDRKLGDIMRVDLDQERPQWEKITPSNGIILDPICNHTGNFINGKYYIIGGSDESIQQSPYIYIYDVENNILEKEELPKNDNTCFLSFHTADYYENEKSLILFGGFSHGNVLRTVYKYNIETREFSKISYKGEEAEEGEKKEEVDGNANANSDFEYQSRKKKNEIFQYKEKDSEKEDPLYPSARTGHSSFISGDSLYIFGGSLKDGTLLNDLWKFNIPNKAWTKLFPTAEIEEQIKNGEESQEITYPCPRSGHSMLLMENEVLIFGGRIGPLSECNDLWKYDISANTFTLIHDTILEQFTDEEIKEFLSNEKNSKENKAKFHFITKKELDDRKNPFSKLYQQKNKQGAKVLVKSQSVRDITRNDYEKEIFVNPGYYRMKHSSIFNLDSKGVSTAIANLDYILPYKTGEKGIKVPLPRSGQSLDIYNNQLVVFGGDRNKYPFNDLYVYPL